MSVLETVKSALSPAKLNPAARYSAQVAERLAVAKQRLADVAMEHSRVALEAVESGSDDALHQWRGRRDEAERAVSDLQAAFVEAQRRDEEISAQEATRRQETAIRSATQKLAAANKKILALRSAAENYATAYFDAYRLICEAKETAQSSGLAWLGDTWRTPTRSATPEERARGITYGSAEPVFTRGRADQDYSWANEDRFRTAVETELLRVGHGPQSGGALYPHALPGAANAGAVTARLKIDPGFYKPLDKTRGVHSEWARTEGRQEEFGALTPIDEAFAAMREHIMARVRGTVPAEPAAPPAELFIGTSSPTFDLGAPLVDTAHTQPIPTVTPHGEPAVGVDPRTKLLAEEQAYAAAATAGLDLMAIVQERFGAPPSGVPKDRWPDLVKFYDHVSTHHALPGAPDA